ncbi:MAG: DCC1-like thiol-disulfide oxidoreductase family protein [Phycisphaeraceae bacterium]
MNNRWTGGQYSLFRFVFGAYLFGTFLCTAWGQVRSAGGVASVIAAIVCVFLMGGWFDRAAAIVIAALVWAMVAVRSMPVEVFAAATITMLLVAHASLPAAAYGSVAGYGRADPRGAWRMRPVVFVAVWMWMAISYTVYGFTLLYDPAWRQGDAIVNMAGEASGALAGVLAQAPDELMRIATWGVLGLLVGFAPLAVVGRVRPWLWSAMLLVNLLRLAVFGHSGFGAAMVMVHGMTFDPEWVKARRLALAGHDRQQIAGVPETTETIFYDGQCGLCHRWVRFVLAEDRDGSAFRFAPLQSGAFERAVPIDQRATLSGTIVVRTSAGAVLSRSAAVIHVLRGLGGVWRLIGAAVRLVPRPIRDFGYDCIAAVRYRLFKRPADACPLLAADLRGRFDD